MSANIPGKPSAKKEIWQQWDNAWDLNIPVEKRLEFLKLAAEPSFLYCNAVNEIALEGDLSQLAQIIDRLLQEAGNNLTVKHLKWWEHHKEIASHWNMLHVETKEPVVEGWTYAKFADSGKLQSVSDFY